MYFHLYYGYKYASNMMIPCTFTYISDTTMFFIQPAHIFVLIPQNTQFQVFSNTNFTEFFFRKYLTSTNKYNLFK